jgi:uncharacterized membrane protein
MLDLMRDLMYIMVNCGRRGYLTGVINHCALQWDNGKFHGSDSPLRLTMVNNGLFRFIEVFNG